MKIKKRISKLISKVNIISVIWILFVLGALFYFLLQKDNNVVEEIIKKDFIVEVKSFEDFDNKISINKTGKINSTQELKILSNATGRIKNISVKVWDVVNSWDILAKLEDNIANYSINLEKAKNALDRAKITYDSNKINLDKQVFDAEVNLKKLLNNLQALKDWTVEDIRQAETNLNNSDYFNIDSSSALQLQKLDNSITKAELDYENTKIANEEKLLSNYYSIKKEHNALMSFMDDIIQFSDKILWVTNENKNNNDSFQDFLWAKNTGQKYETEDNLRNIISYRENEFKNIIIDNVNTWNSLIEILWILNNWYDYSKVLLSSLEETLNNSISSEWSLSQSSIDSYISSINIYQTTHQSYYSSFISFDSSVKSFLRTYLNAEDSILKSIELLKKDREILKKSLSVWWESAEVGYNKTIINSNDAIDTLELQVKSAENNYMDAQKTREVTLRSLNNAINEANISYRQSSNEYEKLIIKSPISWVIDGVFIDLWQEISNWTQVFSISNNSNNEISISFNKEELNYISEWMKVMINFNQNTYNGSIYSISKNADSNLNYISKIILSDWNNIIWNIVSVSIPIELKNTIIPINIIKIKNWWIWTINVLEGEIIKKLDVKLWNIYSDKIEILDILPTDTKIITSYIDNFDSEKFILKIK